MTTPTTSESAHTRPRVGLVGLGNMGAAVAERLLTFADVSAFDLSAARRADARALGVEVTDSLAGLAGHKVVLLSLPTPAISATVAAELAPQLPEGALLIETSTVNPQDMRQLAKICAAAGVRVVDAAILSGVAGMRQGTTTMLVGGAEADVADALPIVQGLCNSHVVLGELGAGMAAKVINNAVAHSVMVMLIEALTLGERSGVDLDKLVELLADPEAGLTRPLTHRVRERIREGNYEGGMPLEAARKDSTLAVTLAAHLQVPLFAISGTHAPYELGVAAGMGREDYAALARLWETWCGVDLRREGDAS